MEPLDLKTPLWYDLYLQKCEHIGIEPTAVLFERFITAVTPRMREGVLDLRDQGLRAESVPLVCELLRHFQGRVHSLVLDLNPLLDAGAEALLQGGDAFLQLRSVSLRSVGLSPEGFASFFTALAGLPNSIEALDLSSTSEAERRNRPGKPGARALAAYLSASPSLLRLDLTNTQLRDEAGVLIFRRLTRPLGLRELVLRNTDLTDAAVAQIFAERNFLADLVYLDLSRNGSTLTARSCEAIAAGLARMQHLHRLDLSGNRSLGPLMYQVFGALRHKSADALADTGLRRRRMDSRIAARTAKLRAVHLLVRNLLSTGKIVTASMEDQLLGGTGEGAGEGAAEGEEGGEGAGSGAGDPAGAAGAAGTAGGAGEGAGARDPDGAAPGGPPGGSGNPEGQNDPDDPDEAEEGAEPVYTETCSVRALDLSGVPLTCEGLRELGLALRHNETLRSLTLSGCAIDLGREEFVRPFTEFCAGAGKLPRLMELDLSKNGLTDVAAPALAELIAASPSLRSLNLGYAQLGDEGISVIAEALPRSPGCLRALDLAGNNGTDVCAKALHARMQDYKQLTTLNMSLNKLSFTLSERLRLLLSASNEARLAASLEGLKGQHGEEVRKLEELHGVQAQIDACWAEFDAGCARLGERSEEILQRYKARLAEVQQMRDALEEARRASMAVEARLTEANTQVSQHAQKAESDLLVIETKRRHIRDKCAALQAKIKGFEKAKEEFMESVGATDIAPRQKERDALKAEHDDRHREIAGRLAVLVAVEQQLIAAGKVKVAAGAGGGAAAGSAAVAGATPASARPGGQASGRKK